MVCGDTNHGKKPSGRVACGDTDHGKQTQGTESNVAKSLKKTYVRLPRSNISHAMNDDLFTAPRNSRMAFGEVYFWTDTIHDWKRLLTPDSFRWIIIQCWQELVRRGQVIVYSFVIMPNHLHVVWEMCQPNGREMPHASFNKFTAHQFLKHARRHHPNVLPYFQVDNDERTYRFWQRDTLAVLMDTPAKVEQKIEYIHTNPLQERWLLALRPEDYRWSSARFYETGEDEFAFLTHYKERFG